MLYRNSLTINTIAAAAVLILLVRPLDLWSISFQLSFAATIAIVIFAKGMEQLMPLQQSGNRWKNWIITYILGTITVSIAAQLGTLPITMYTFGLVSNYFLLTNLIVLPIASFLVPIGLATVVLSGTPLGTLFGHASYGLAWLMNHAVGWIEQLPGSVTQVHINAWMVLLLYAAMVMGWLTMHRSLWWLIGVASTMIGFCIVYTL
jgi:competence protein ComEC